jgi:hypothetical protein
VHLLEEFEKKKNTGYNNILNDFDFFKEDYLKIIFLYGEIFEFP